VAVWCDRFAPGESPKSYRGLGSDRRGVANGLMSVSGQPDQADAITGAALQPARDSDRFGCATRLTQTPNTPRADCLPAP
jgi:hypothetical protein